MRRTALWVMRAAAGRVRERLVPDESGMELVQMAIGLFITAVMGTVLYAAVQSFWPSLVQTILQDVRGIFSG